MNIEEHPIYKQIYELCLEIEKLPASEQATKIVTMAGDLNKPASELVNALRPFASGVDILPWGKIKAKLSTDLAKELTKYNYLADKALAK